MRKQAGEGKKKELKKESCNTQTLIQQRPSKSSKKNCSYRPEKVEDK
jgi:hypothetical protein